MNEIIDLICEFWILGFFGCNSIQYGGMFHYLKKELDKTYPEDIDFDTEEDKR